MATQEIHARFERLVSHRLWLDDVNRGFELMEAPDGIRSLVDFD